MLKKFAYIYIGGLLFVSLGFISPFLLEPTLATLGITPVGRFKNSDTWSSSLLLLDFNLIGLAYSLGHLDC